MVKSFYIRLFIVFALQAVVFCARSQPVSFYHINTSSGLSDNNVRAIAMDSSGFLWIGTTEGLNVFDGYGVTRYFKEQEPNLVSNHIIDLFCDSRNRIWISTQDGASLVDSKRRFQRISLQDSISHFGCASVLETQSAGIVLLTTLGQFYFNADHQKWELLDSNGSQLNYDNFMDATHFTADQILYTTNSKVLILDYAFRKIVYEQPFSGSVSACRVNDSTIAVGIQTGVVQLVNIRTKKVVGSYRLTGELDGKTINTNLRELRITANGSLIASTGSAGLIAIDKKGTITNHTHDPVNPRSIASNNTFRVLPGKNGEVIIGTRTSGVNIYNSNNLQAGYTPIFKDKSGNLFDSYLNEIVADKRGNLWIGAYDRVIRWDKKKNESQFFYYYRENPLQGLRTVEIKALCFDKLGRLWVSALGDGIGILNEATGKFTKLAQDSSLGPALRSYYGRDMLTASDGRIWVGTNGGIFAVDPTTMAVTAFSNHPLLKEMAGKRVGALFEDSHGKIWIGVQDAGIYCYDKNNNRLLRYTARNGLVANTFYAFAESSKGELYAASQNGFSIITPDESIRSFTRLNGLRYSRCDGFLEDDKGNMWIANNKCLIKMSADGSMKYYEGNAGLSIEGFRASSCLKTKDGELIWGSQHGINYFHPDQLFIAPEQLKVNISRATLHDSAIQVGEGAAFRLPYANNGIIFHFTAINLQGSSNIIYQYILDGYDKDWQQGIDIKEVRYTGLPPGEYRFKVKASADKLHWTLSNNEVNITIIPPLWQRWWFIAAIGVLVAALVFLYIDNRNKKLKRQKEELETEQAINYFASSMYEQQTVETILWDVAKNCIGRLQFEDCVVYLLDEKRKVLIQKAAHGPKDVGKFEIKQPIDIPIGKGIVGSVAASGRAELIHDTSKDPRYIVDDERRYSEISVPIVSDGKVLGVIDCEHSKKNFFTQKHLSILTTIASLCASKIVRVMTEKEIQEAHIRLIDTQRKMAEAEMQALRAQMNPHFIFNCLNSINRYIVKSDQATASLYLTRFARLIRLILDNSNNKNVTLSRELEALKLYIEMEALRFDNRFAYSITLDENVNSDSVEVPPLIIQPYVENAIWHGLLHLEKGGRLNVHVTMICDGMLQCTIEDDGVGRGKARELKSKSATTRKSLGMKLTEDRISLVNKHAQLNASVEIIDLVHPDGEAAGTKVIIQIPV